MNMSTKRLNFEKTALPLIYNSIAMITHTTIEYPGSGRTQKHLDDTCFIP